jgi:hypothetical protein
MQIKMETMLLKLWENEDLLSAQDLVFSISP